MTHPRATLRSAVRAAMAGSPRFADFTDQRAWSRDVSPDSLPMYLVATPRETVQAATGSQSDRATDVMVSVRRTGGDDLEDILDDDSAAIEALVLPILEDMAGQLYGLETTDTAVNADGGQRIGRLDMVFRVVRYTPEGLAE